MITAALDIARQIGSLKTPAGFPLQVRIGIATGLVVVGESIGTGPAFEQSVIGETPNRAARLQALAGPDGIVIDAATRRQVGELFELADLGLQVLKGFPGYGYNAIALWNLGRPDQALASARRGIALATNLGHAPSLAHGLWLAGFVHQMRRDGPAALETAERLMALARQHDFAVHHAAARVLKGWAGALLGAAERDGLTEMRAAVKTYRRLAGVMLGPYLVSLADSERRAHHFDRAEGTLHDAEAVVTQRGEQIWIGAVLRARGDVAASRPTSDLATAEDCYTRALAIARRTGSRSLELRAAKGLARVWQRQHKTTEARDLLAPVLTWFTEGFDTLDLIEAKAVLDKLK